MSITMERPVDGGNDEHDNPKVSLVKEAAATETASTAGRFAFLSKDAIAEHLGRSRATTWSWLTAEQVSEAELTAEVIQGRKNRHATRERELRRAIKDLARQVAERRTAEAGEGRKEDSAEVSALRAQRKARKAELAELTREETVAELDDAPSKGELARVRWGRRAMRSATLGGALFGGTVLLPMSDPLWLIASIPAGAFALWRAGSVQPEGEDEKEDQAVTVTAVPGQRTNSGDGGQQDKVAPDQNWPDPIKLTVAQAEALGADVPAGVLPPDPTVPPEGTFPISQVSTPAWAAECIRRALVKAEIKVGQVYDVARRPWGWTAMLRLSEGTPAPLIKAAPALETLLDLESGRFIPTPTKRAAVVELKVLETDPFTFVPAPPERAPKSMSLKDKALLGYGMDARPLEMSLYGIQGAIVAGSGGGKSATIRTLVEYLTACRDVVVVGLDPTGVGLGPFDAAAAMTLTDKEEIATFLRGMHKVSLGRPELLTRLKMGTEWQPSERWPALIAIGDEWPQNTDEAKESGVGVQVTGRKACVQLLLASQFATQDYIGSAIISNLSLQILGPCRQADVVGTFGGGAIDAGWLPHRLVPKQADDLNDCGRFYLRGGGYSIPTIWRGNWYPDETSERLASERAAAGITQLDPESMALGGKDFEALFTRRGTKARTVQTSSILHDVVTVLRAAGLDRARTERLAELLQQHNPAAYGSVTGAQVGDRLRAGGAGGTVKLGPTDGMANPNGYRLIDLSEALEASS